MNVSAKPARHRSLFIGPCPPRRSRSYSIAAAINSGELTLGRVSIADNVLCGERTLDVIDVRRGDGVSSGT